jgi:hypothetical protein
MTANEDFFANRVDHLTLAGKKEVALDVHALAKAGKLPKSDYDVYYLLDYSAGPRGGLVALLGWHQPDDPGEAFMHVTRYGILTINDKSDLRSLVKLNLTFSPTRVAVFSSGSYLIAGFEKESLASLRFAILDAQGNSTIDNVKPFAAASHSTEVNASGSLLLASGSDGHVYLYSSREPEAIRKLSIDGKADSIPVGKLPVKDGETILPLSLYAFNGQLLFQRAVFAQDKPKNLPGSEWSLAAVHYWSVYDAASGKLVENDEAGTGTAAGMLAGYEPGNFLFLERQTPVAGTTAFTLLHATP